MKAHRRMPFSGLLKPRKTQSPQDPQGILHFLHIGKTGGTQIEHLLEEIFPRERGVRYIIHKHTMPMRKLPQEAKYFFSIRKPPWRFRSAFYDRKRFGRYRKVPWSIEEEKFFSYFEDASEVAEVLFDDSAAGRIARQGVRSTEHMRTPQVEWFFPHGSFLEFRPPVGIIRQEHLWQDFFALAQALGWDLAPIKKPKTAVNATDYSGIPEFSERGLTNLNTWYSNDVMFYEEACQFIKERSARSDQETW